MFPIPYSTLPIIHKNRIKTEGRGAGGLHILSWDRSYNIYSLMHNFLSAEYICFFLWQLGYHLLPKIKYIIYFIDSLAFIT